VSNLKTDARIVVHVLLRGILPSDHGSGEVQLAGHTVTILGPATPEKWSKAQLAEGDLHGIVWTSARELVTMMGKLSTCEEVVDAQSGGGNEG
jgi:hypothetical protein